MKKLILLLFLLPTIAFGQTTLIPDPYFEQALITLGYDIGTPDGSVPTANISGVTDLDVEGGPFGGPITDLTGIEDFTALTELDCGNQQLTSLDISNNTALTSLDCAQNELTSIDVSNNTALTNLYLRYNQLTSLDVSNNTALIWLICEYNQLTALDVSNNTALTSLRCYNNQLTSLDISNNTALTSLSCQTNQLTSLDVSNNTALTHLYCYWNQLTCLNVKNGNNTNMTWFQAYNNQYLTCMEVDDEAYSNTIWVVNSSFSFDPQTSFSENCNYPSNCFAVGIPELPTKPKDLLYITDILGRTTLPVPNRLLFYIYDDGSVEKKIRLER